MKIILKHSSYKLLKGISTIKFSITFSEFEDKSVYTYGINSIFCNKGKKIYFASVNLDA